MKKTYLYFIVPLVLTAAFAVFYASYASDYDAKIEAMEAKKREERKQKLDEEARQREKAIADAVAQTEKRKKEKAEREAKEAAEKEKRDLAVQERNKLNTDSRKLADQVRRLQKDVEEAKAEIEVIQKRKKESLDEQAFLHDYVKQAEANTQSLSAALEKLEAAEKARAEAEKAAAKKS